MSIKLVIDTTADLWYDDLDKEITSILPIPVFFGDEEYHPFEDLPPIEFYEKQKTSKLMTRTSQVPYPIMLDCFKSAIEKGDDIIAIFIASKMSGTFNTARLVLEELEESMPESKGHIFIIDAKTVTFPYSALVFEAYKMIKENKLTPKEIYERILYLVPRSKMFACIDDLTYLKMGGRISGPTAVLANFFNFKPIIKIDDGEIEAVNKQRGFLKALVKICDLINMQDVDYDLPCYIGHTNDLAKAAKLKELLLANTKLRPERIIMIGPTVGAHAGPGSTGICYFIK